MTVREPKQSACHCTWLGKCDGGAGEMVTHQGLQTTIIRKICEKWRRQTAHPAFVAAYLPLRKAMHQVV